MKSKAAKWVMADLPVLKRGESNRLQLKKPKTPDRKLHNARSVRINENIAEENKTPLSTFQKNPIEKNTEETAGTSNKKLIHLSPKLTATNAIWKDLKAATEIPKKENDDEIPDEQIGLQKKISLPLSLVFIRHYQRGGEYLGFKKMKTMNVGTSVGRKL